MESRLIATSPAGFSVLVDPVGPDFVSIRVRFSRRTYTLRPVYVGSGDKLAGWSR